LPWDYWLQCLRQNGYGKLPVSGFCRSVLAQLGLPEHDCHVVPLGYSPEILEEGPPQRRESRFRFLTVTNSHDLGRYNTDAVIEAFDAAFEPGEDVALVVKDYGAASGDATLRGRLARRGGGPRVDYLTEFTGKRELIRLYKSSDAFVSAHRGEGFAMKILDAMACGLPVITPLFGGPTEYCTAENCLPVAFSLVPMGDCLDTRSLRITNDPLWAEADVESLRRQMRYAYDRREESSAVGARGRDEVVGRYTWEQAARTLIGVASTVRAGRPAPRMPEISRAPKAERSPYWLGLRVSVIVPTRNRKDKLANCLDALARQSILPQEFEVIVVDDGSTDGTRQWLEGRTFPFRLRCLRQEESGPGAARNLAVDHAEGELVLFIGDDIYAGERLLEEHLLAHAINPAPGLAVLGHIDWPAAMRRNAVMEYVCGDAMLQFAYSYIPTAPALDHRFFYTSNLSLRRRFLAEAAAEGVRFDPRFFHAAFEDSELAYRLIPRGLQIRYAAAARAYHDHFMDLASFAERELRAGQMAVVFYRKHPAEDPRLQVQWIADLVEPAAALIGEPGFLRRLEEFDAQTDTLLASLAGALEQLSGIDRIGDAAGARTGGSAGGVDVDRFRAALHNVLRVVFDVQRTRGKLQEWFSPAADRAGLRAAQTLASVMRKIEFLSVSGTQLGALGETIAPFDPQTFAELSGRLARIPGMPAAAGGADPGRQVRRRLRRFVAQPRVVSRLIRADRFVEARVQSMLGPRWLAGYRRVRSRLRAILA
jgi:glycosyltransferase involved in cell wall biosynthesis